MPTMTVRNTRTDIKGFTMYEVTANEFVGIKPTDREQLARQFFKLDGGTVRVVLTRPEFDNHFLICHDTR